MQDVWYTLPHTSEEAWLRSFESQLELKFRENKTIISSDLLRVMAKQAEELNSQHTYDEFLWYQIFFRFICIRAIDGKQRPTLLGSSPAILPFVFNGANKNTGRC